MRKNFIEFCLFGLAFAWIVFGFCMLSASMAHGDTLSINQFPKQPAPTCAGVMCVEVR